MEEIELPIKVPTVEDLFLSNLPFGVTLLPEKWQGDTTRVMLKFAVSRQAVNNKKFDLRGFIKAKFDNALTAIRRRWGFDGLRLKPKLRMTIDPNRGNGKTMVYISIEYAKEEL